VLLFASTASADEDKGLYERLWPRMPNSEQLVDHIAELGNILGYHANVLSHDMVALKFDGRRRRAFVAVGGGDDRFLTFKLASDIEFTEGLARVNTRVDLAFHGKKLELQIPEVEMAPAEYRGDRGVEVRLPLFRRRF